MTPLFLFRMWLRRAPAANRVSAATSLVLVIALLVWIAVPGGSSNSRSAFGPAAALGGNSSEAAAAPTGAGAVGAASAAASVAVTPPAGVAPPLATVGPGVTPVGPAATTAAPGSVPTPSGGTKATSAPTSRPQVSASASTACPGKLTPLKVGVILPNVGSGSASLNSAFGVPPLAEQQGYYDAAFDSLNKSGGVRCHTLVPDYQAFNELDSTGTAAICSQFAQDKVFAVLGGFQPGGADTCLMQAHLPTFEQIMLSEVDAQKFYPYYFSVAGSFEGVMKNFVYSMAQMGQFGPARGFKKLGVAYRDCFPNELTAFNRALADKGITSAQIDTFNFGCTGSVNDPPSAIQQAVLQFQQHGVTHVTFIQNFQDIQIFTKDASLQGFKPQYLIPDDGGFATITTASRAPDANNFDGAIGITPLQYGGIEAGFPEDAATKRCDAIMTSHGQKGVYASPVQFAGVPCSLTWILAAAMAAEPPGEVTQTGLAPALQKVGSIALSFPHGPNDFRQPGVTWGGQGWRQDIFHADCGCFKAVGPAFNPKF